MSHVKIFKKSVLFCSGLADGQRFAENHWTSVVTNGSKIFAALNDPMALAVIDVIDSQFSLIDSSKINGVPGTVTTLGVSKDEIVSCSSEKNNYHFYSAKANLLRIVEGPRKRNTHDVHIPYICDGDAAGNLLVADHDGMVVMNRDGEFKYLTLQPDVIEPRCAVRFKNSLFVVSLHGQRILKYTQ